MTEGDELKSAIDALEQHIDREIQQLTEALNSTTDLSALRQAVNASVSRLSGLSDRLKADDEPTAPSSPTA